MAARKAAAVSIRCSRCDGCGRTPLSPELAAVLGLLDDRAFASTPDLGEKLGVRPTAMAMRLARLLAHDLVEKRPGPGATNEWRRRRGVYGQAGA